MQHRLLSSSSSSSFHSQVARSLSYSYGCFVPVFVQSRRIEALRDHRLLFNLEGCVRRRLAKEREKVRSKRRKDGKALRWKEEKAVNRDRLFPACVRGNFLGVRSKLEQPSHPSSRLHSPHHDLPAFFLHPVSFLSLLHVSPTSHSLPSFPLYSLFTLFRAKINERINKKNERNTFSRGRLRGAAIIITRYYSPRGYGEIRLTWYVSREPLSFFACSRPRWYAATGKID